MNMSGREKAIAASTLVVLLYGVLGLLAKGRLETWQIKRDAYRQVCRSLDDQRKLLAQRGLWQKNYAAVQHLMEVFPADRPMETFWLEKIDAAARGNKLNINKWDKAPPETLVGDVYEWHDRCIEWDGPLDSLVHFLYELESNGVMLDVREMYMRPSKTDHSHLTGSFVIYCAYLREPPASAARKSQAAPAAPPHQTPSKK